MTATAPSISVRSFTWPRWLTRLALPALFTAALAYLVVVPLWRIQAVALEDDAHGYRSAFGASRFGETLVRTIVLALGSLVIGLVLGTSLAWAATKLPHRWRILAAVLDLVIAEDRWDHSVVQSKPRTATVRLRRSWTDGLGV